MDVRFYNAKVFAMDSGESEILEGEVWVRGNEISFVGTNALAKDKLAEMNHTNNSYGDNGNMDDGMKTSSKWDREIDCEGNLLMPGFKNAHTHSPMTFLRSYADDMALQDWLHKQVFPMEAKLTDEDMYILTKLAIMEYLTSGITSCFDMYISVPPRVKAALECGYRMVLCGAVNDFTSSVEQMEREYLAYSDKSSLVTYRLGFHAEYTTSKDKIEGIATLAEKYRAPVFMHLSETEHEVEDCRRRYGMSPVKFLEACGIFRYGGGGFHCVHVSDEDMEILKERNVTVVTNPASNLKLASGIAPLVEMEERGILIAIGTDGAASNNCLDMFREMFLVTTLQKLNRQDAAAMQADKVLTMAVGNGAYAMGLQDCDCLSEGKKADLILIDLHKPNMQPENHILKNLVYSGSKDNVKLTMVDGKILYEEHQFDIGVSSEEIYKKANEIISRMKCE